MVSRTNPLHVVIVGGGFGGVRVALNLAGDNRFKVTLISRETFFEYHAALYRSATGRSPLEVALPLRELFDGDKNIEVILDEITEFNAATHELIGVSGSKWRYDSLVLAVGSVTDYFGIKGLDQYSHGVKTVNEALEFKRYLHDSLVKGLEEHNYVIVGGGASGVELSAELKTYLERIRRNHQLDQNFHVHLVEAADKVLPPLPKNFTDTIEKHLKKIGVILHLNSAVKGETRDGISLPEGLLPSHTVVWTAGMTNNPLYAGGYLPLAKNHRVIVDDSLQAMPDLYVIGDSADTRFSGMAQTAISHANYVSYKLKREVNGNRSQPYEPDRPIYAIPVGAKWSAVLWGKLKIYGRLGWLLRRIADLRLYVRFMGVRRGLTVWRYGVKLEEACPICLAAGKSAGWLLG